MPDYFPHQSARDTRAASLEAERERTERFAPLDATSDLERRVAAANAERDEAWAEVARLQEQLTKTRTILQSMGIR